MPSIAFGAAALIVFRSFINARRWSGGAAARYSLTVFAFVVILAGRFVVRVTMPSTSRRILFRSAVLGRLWPHEPVEGPALALGRASRAALAYEDPRHSLHDRSGRTVVDQACRRHRSPDPLIDDGDHLKDARALDERLDAVAGLHRGRRLGWGEIGRASCRERV